MYTYFEKTEIERYYILTRELINHLTPLIITYLKWDLDH